MMMRRLVFRFLLALSLGALGCGDGSGGSGGSAGSGGVGGTGGVMMFEPGPTCTAFCAKVIGDCGVFTFDEASCRQGCEGNLAEERAVSEVCGDAVEAVFQCVSELDCDGVNAWLDQTPSDAYPCRAEVTAVDAVREVDPACAQNAQN
jgi:hypothetical protein